jgi:hypothetical protein
MLPVMRVGLAVLAAVISGLSSPRPAQVAAGLPPGLPPVQTAHALQVAIRHHRQVGFDANVQVEALMYTRKHEWLVETTSVPLVYLPDPARPDDVTYFRVVGYRLATLRVKPIPQADIVGTKPDHWAYRRPRVAVTTHRGVVRTRNAGHAPALIVRLSDGNRLEVPVGLSRINENPE